MHEIILNLHMHTRYSDGHASHAEIAQAALRAGLDAVIVTDHNVYVSGPERYYQEGDQRVLLMVGEEVHDQARIPQKNHLLVIGAGREVATLAYDTQRLINQVHQVGGLTFIAHPHDPAAPAVDETDITWEDWDVHGFTGIELWNGFSEFKNRIKSKAHAVYYAFNPERIAEGPAGETLRKWDELLARGRPVVAVGGSDAHGLPARLGPLRRTIFPYEFHFRTINTHVLLPTPLSGEVAEDRRLILDALARGRCFVGYDLPAPTRGFRFKAQTLEDSACMGEEINSKWGVTLQIRLPRPANFRLIKNGKVERTWQNREAAVYNTTEPGVYRVEAYLEYLGRERGWIFSNPIYVK
ncbi:MAG: CehA/McbA family metallohydrolase [Chloroflexi bacterium]|jgi:hypothetical protein|nr:CehA/McbA family metallohydrolase [Chloroflexota bacterium]